MIDVFISMMAISIAIFTLLLLTFQAPSPSKSSLMLVLLCLLFLSFGPIVFAFIPTLKQLYISALPLLFFTLLPALWFYHEALIAEGHWFWQWSMWKHFTPLPAALLLGIAIFLLSSTTFNEMFFSDYVGDELWVSILSIAFFVAVMGWCLLSFIYVVKLLLRTAHYKQRLKEVYSNEQGKSLNWLSGTLLLIIFTWFYALTALVFGDTLNNIGLSETGVLLLLMGIVWIISANGLIQRPGFEESSLPEQASQPQHKKTYERSALTDIDLLNIAEKLTVAINSDNAHLEHDLTLAKLSALIGEQPQYVSQTLSQHLNTTFFDFINFARIDDAKLMLIESNKSVLNISLETGFNSRSSFYKAFKQFTGLTPSQYRKTRNS